MISPKFLDHPSGAKERKDQVQNPSGYLQPGCANGSGSEEPRAMFWAPWAPSWLDPQLFCAGSSWGRFMPLMPGKSWGCFVTGLRCNVWKRLHKYIYIFVVFKEGACVQHQLRSILDFVWSNLSVYSPEVVVVFFPRQTVCDTFGPGDHPHIICIVYYVCIFYAMYIYIYICMYNN